MMDVMSLKRSLYWAAGLAAIVLFLANIAQLRWMADETIWLQFSVYLFAFTIVLAWCAAIGLRSLVIFLCCAGASVFAYMLSHFFTVPFLHASFPLHVGPLFYGTPVILIILFPSVCLSSVSLLMTDDENAFDWIFDAAIFTTLIYVCIDAVLVAERVQVFAGGPWTLFGIPFCHIVGVFTVSCGVCGIAVALIKKILDLKASQATQSVALIAMLLLFGVSMLKYPLTIPTIIAFSLIAFLYLRFFDHLRNQKKPNPNL
jgi:hypothetical protein